jgi:thioredoxin reductase (NADPH)
MDDDTPWDSIIVGAGPAGLTAALYLARFRRRTLVLHDGTARALRIPKTHNAPGFPDGISGPELLERMLDHAERYGAAFELAHVLAGRTEGDLFQLEVDDGRVWIGRTLLLATGADMNEAPMPHAAHEAAVAAGTLRYCPICDGEEHAGQRIGVIGCDSSGAAEAMFLRTWSNDITLVPFDVAALAEDERARLAGAGIRVMDAPLARLDPVGKTMRIWLEGQEAPLEVDVVYPALGTFARSELGRQLGLERADRGCLGPQSPFGTAVPGLFAAGDVVEGLDQISVAMGHGAIAATRAHNWLRETEAG